jgi:hypothetical protein
MMAPFLQTYATGVNLILLSAQVLFAPLLHMGYLAGAAF